MKQGLMGLAACALALAAAQAGAQPAYKCASRGGGVTYSQVPCPGARDVTKPRSGGKSDPHAVPPQDRAHRVQRAMLPPDTQAQCKVLDAKLAQEEAAIAQLPHPATAGDEKGLLNARMEYRKLHC